jgi:hypothetical protein
MININKVYISIGIILIIISFFIGRFTVGTIDTKIKVTVPEVKNTSELIINPEPVKNKIKDSIVYKDSVIYHTKFNKALAQDFINTTSDIEKLNKFISAVELNEYEIPYDDEFLSTKSYIKTEGKVISFRQDYVIKERKIGLDVKVPAKVNFLIGSSVENTIKLDEFNIKVLGGIQRKNGDIILGGYGLNKTIEVGYLFKL